MMGHDTDPASVIQCDYILSTGPSEVMSCLRTVVPQRKLTSSGTG